MSNKERDKVKRLGIAAGVAVASIFSQPQKSNAENNFNYQPTRIESSIEVKLDKCLDAHARCKRTNRDLREVSDRNSRSGFQMRSTIQVKEKTIQAHEDTIHSLKEQVIGLKAQIENERKRITQKPISSKGITPITTLALELCLVLFGSAINSFKNSIIYLRHEQYKKAFMESLIGLTYVTLGIKVLRNKV